MLKQLNIGIIGGGNMARCLIGGLIANGQPAGSISFSEPLAEPREALTRDFGVRAMADNNGVAGAADVLVLAVKPQIMKSVCVGIAATLRQRRPLVISIAAGIRIIQLADWLGPDLPIVRAMPNTPALIGSGITGLYPNPRVGATERGQTEALLTTTGSVVWVEHEGLMDTVTAVSGSGPAYFFLLMEALEQSAIEQGVPPVAARKLVLETAYGAACMARQSDAAPSTLRERVTSPGGTTQAAMEILEPGGLRQLIVRAVARATERGVELSEALGD